MSLCLIPDIILPSLTDLTPELLQTRGISFLMMDFDNTIVPYTTDVPTEPMRAWLEQMKSSNIRRCVVSNSKRPRVVTFCRTYGLDCITHARKPFQKGISECLTALSPEAVAGGAGGGPDLHGCPGRKLRGADVHFSLCN